MNCTSTKIYIYIYNIYIYLTLYITFIFNIIYITFVRFNKSIDPGSHPYSIYQTKYKAYCNEFSPLPVPLFYLI